MRIGWIGIEQPLLMRELIEQSMRPRTYVVRMICAAVLFALFSFLLYARFAGGRASIGHDAAPALAMSGQGRALFDWVVVMQLIGVFAFLPAMMADAITRERERSALDLLLITELRPWDIVAQKLMSRLVPMATILMLTFPLLGVAYTYGGVDASALWSAVWVVLLTCLQVGAICLALSIDAPRTSTAMTSCYVRLPLVLLLWVVIGTAAGVVWKWGLALVLGGGGLMTGPGGAIGFLDHVSGIVEFACVVPAGLLLSDSAPPLLFTILFTAPTLVCIVIYLRKARSALVGLVEAPPGERPTPSFELAEVERGRRQRTEGELPDERPIEWMDRTGYLATQLRRVFFVAICVDVPVFLWLASQMIEPDRAGQLPALAYITAGSWVVALLLVAALGASAFASERTGQTLDVLLTTPIATPDLVRQKARWAWGVMWILAIPIGASVLVGAALEYPPHARPAVGQLGYLVSSAASIAVLLPLALWSGMWIGICVRDRGRAIVVVLLAGLTVLAIVPTAVNSALDAFGPQARWLGVLHLLSPATLVWTNERMAWAELGGRPWGWLAAGLGMWASVAAVMRWLCLYRSDPWLGRAAAGR